LLFVLMIASLLFSSFLPSMSALAAGKTAVLDSLHFTPAKGWAVVFEVTGTWKPADLKGHTLSVGGKTIDLYCNFRDDDHISCTMESLNPYVGQTAVIFFNGQTFSAEVPGKRAASGFAECPSGDTETVYIYFEDGDGLSNTGFISYNPADMFTIQEALAAWLSIFEISENIVFYEITDVTCTSGGDT
jgi:hypothetical protein